VSRNPLVKSAQTRAVAQATSRGSVVVRPAAALTGELGLSVALWGAASPESLPWMTSGLALSTAAMAGLVWQVGRDRSPVGRVLSIGTTALTGAHLIAASVVGPFASPLIGVWGWLGGSMAAAWVVRLWVARGHTQLEEGRRQVSLWDQATKRVGGALEGSEFRPKEIDQDRMAGPLELEGGETVSDAQASLARLVSVLKLPPGGARITPDPDDASRGELTLVRRDLLRESTPYTEPSALGESSALPTLVGRYEHGRPAWLHQHRPGWGEVHLIIMGMTGSGKTYGAYTLFAEDFTRTDVFHVYVDTAKGAQTLGPIARGIRWVISTEAEALALMTAIKDRVIPARANYLGRRRLKSWEPGCGIPRLVVHVEEGGGLFLGNKAFTRVMERARSVGIQIRLSGQRFSYASIDTSARAQFSGVWCFGVSDDDDAKFAMPEGTLEAGANPARWKNRQPGCSYLVDPVIEEREHVVPLRSLEIRDEQLELLAEYAHRHGADLDEDTARAFGELYASRVPVERMLAGDAPLPTTVDDEDGEDGEDGPVDVDEEPVLEPPWRPGADDPAPEVQPDIDEPLERPTGSTLRFGQPAAAKATPEQAAAMLETRLIGLQQERREEVRAADLVEVARAAGRSPAWVYKQLRRRVDSGHLVRTDSGFRFARSLTNA